MEEVKNEEKNSEAQQETEKRILQWRFWFSLVFSLFLIITFVYYLPLRFEHQGTNTAHMEEIMEGQRMHMEDDLHDANQYHEESMVEEGLEVNLNVSPVPFLAGTPVRLDFFVNQKPSGAPVAARELQIEHAKLMHVIGLRQDMNEFFHIHPEITETPGLFSVEHIFAKPGFYKILSEVTQNGTTHSFGHPELSVSGEGARFEKQVNFGRNVIVGDYQVLFSHKEPIVKSIEYELSFDVHTLDSHEVELEPYLEAQMHLAIIKDDGKQFIHTHPEENDDHHGLKIIPEVFANGGGHDTGIEGHGLNFHVTFPEAGLYKAFAQFRPRGIDLPKNEALVASFWIEVTDEKPSAIPDRITYTIVSLILIVILSLTVRKYLRSS